MIPSLVNKINDSLQQLCEAYEELKSPIQYALFPGGKRLRPLILLSTLIDLGIDPALGLDVACSLELIHTYSLIHDDLPAMDNDDMRRGKPTVHIMHGEDMAILAGDALLTEAFGVIARSSLTPQVVVKLIALMSDCAGLHGMVRGQVLDLKHGTLNLEQIELIHRLKTTELFRASLLSAAIIADDEDPVWSDIANYFGSAFQIADDLEDLEKEEPTNIAFVVGVEASQQLLVERRNQCLALIEQKLGKKILYHLVESSL